MDDDWQRPIPPPETPRKGRVARAVGVIVVLGTVAAIVGGVLTIVAGNRATDRSHRLDAQARQLRRDRRALLTAIDTTNHRADAPIGKSERVENSLSRIDELAGIVLLEARAASASLGEAVDRENSSGPGAGRSIYEGQAADEVRRLQAVLQSAQVTLAAAVQAAADLRASAP